MTQNLTLHYNRMILILKAGAIGTGLVRRKVEVIRARDATLTKTAGMVDESHPGVPPRKSVTCHCSTISAGHQARG